MMQLATTLSENALAWALLAAAVLYLVMLISVAGYGTDRGYSFWGLLLCELLLGPIGPGLVLLSVIVGGGPRNRQ